LIGVLERRSRSTQTGIGASRADARGSDIIRCRYISHLTQLLPWFRAPHPARIDAFARRPRTAPPWQTPSKSLGKRDIISVSWRT